MRTLLVDNHDSFTYNLFDMIARVNGSEPAVMTNDQPVPDARTMLQDYDNVVISPGPGRPDVKNDFGDWGSVFTDLVIPVLGVCLGHQGMCLFHGGTVAAAPEPMHGRTSGVRHDGSELFSGMPSPFTVVRYHSLAAYDLPAAVEATAWAEDGVVMAARHRTLPHWGVQFHPESISSEHGLTLIRNFTDASADWSERSRGHRPVTRPFRTRRRSQKAPVGPPTHRVLVHVVSATATAEQAFAELYGGSATAFWLDSSGGGRFSFLGDASGPYARVVTADVWNSTVTVTSQAGIEVRKTEFFDWLRDDLASRQVELPAGLPFDFALGWVGYLGYELKAECRGDRVHRASEPDASMIFADRAVVFDHEKGEIYLLVLDAIDDPGGSQRWIDDTRARIAAAVGALTEPGSDLMAGHEVSARHDAGQYLELIEQCMYELAAGETYEVCLTNMLAVDGGIPPWDAYRRLRRLSPAPYGAYLRFGELALLSSSPERFLRINRDGVVESKPIKGTRKRGRDMAEDLLLKEDLRTNAKDLAENLMIVDLVRNDLGRKAEIGSVSVPKLFDVETYATVHQLVSTVRAVKRPEVSAVDVVCSAFPGGSMTGAPKVRTMQIIDELEAGPRGPYSGAMGYLSLSGNVDLGMTIRTVICTPHQTRYGVGGAIVTLSDPHDEVEETNIKARAFADLLGVSTDRILGTTSESGATP